MDIHGFPNRKFCYFSLFQILLFKTFKKVHQTETRFWNLETCQNLSFSVWESININPIMSSLKILKKWNQTKTWYLLTLFILVWFTHQKRRGKIQTGENHVHQGLSKVFVFYTYSCSIVTKAELLLLKSHPFICTRNFITKKVENQKN